MASNTAYVSHNLSGYARSAASSSNFARAAQRKANARARFCERFFRHATHDQLVA